MKLIKYASLMVIGMVMATGLTHAQNLQDGQIQAFIVKGDASIVDNQTGEYQALTRGTTFGQGYTVQTGEQSSVLLLFSNGSSINLQANSSLDISQFLQEPFDESVGSFLTLEADPSQSQTEMMLNYGKLIGEVKKLRPDSDYTVRTPLGAAEIKGTTFSVEFDPNAPGGGQTTILNLDGTVIGVIDGNPLDIAPGQTFLVDGTFNTDTNEWSANTNTIRPSTPEEVQDILDNPPAPDAGVPDADVSATVTPPPPPSTDDDVRTVSPL